MKTTVLNPVNSQNHGGKKLFFKPLRLGVIHCATTVTETHSCVQFPGSHSRQTGLSLETCCDLINVSPTVPAGGRLGHLFALPGHFQTIFHPAWLPKCLFSRILPPRIFNLCGCTVMRCTSPVFRGFSP